VRGSAWRRVRQGLVDHADAIEADHDRPISAGRSAIRLGMQPGLAAVATQIRCHRRTQHEMIGKRHIRSGHGEGGHTSPCVSSGMKASTPAAANECAAKKGSLGVAAQLHEGDGTDCALGC
jgi:hypothetical protein